MTEPGFATGKDGRLRFGIPVCTSSSAELLLDEALDSGHGLDDELDRLFLRCTNGEVGEGLPYTSPYERTDAEDSSMLLERLGVLEDAVVRRDNHDGVLGRTRVMYNTTKEV